MQVPRELVFVTLSTAGPSHPSQPAPGSFSHRLFVLVVAANLAGEKPGLEETEGPGRNVD